MKTVNVNDKNSLEIASKVILEGGLIVYPTDTLYGIGADARNKKAIKNIACSNNGYNFSTPPKGFTNDPVE